MIGVLGLVACGPKIIDFQVFPRRICGPDTVSISYEVKGTALLSVTTNGADDVDTVTYLLVASRRGKLVHAAQDVVRWSVGGEKEFVFLNEPLGRDSVRARGTLDTATWHSRLVLEGIASRSGRAVHVSHSGRSALLPANGDLSSEFLGLPLYGEWDLKAALIPGEVMGDPQRSPPDRLRIVAVLACDTKGLRK